MSLNRTTPARKDGTLIPTPVTDETSAGKLKKSLSYRSKDGKTLIPDVPGTAEHRPRRGLIYDAPLGLKF